MPKPDPALETIQQQELKNLIHYWGVKYGIHIQTVLVDFAHPHEDDLQRVEFNQLGNLKHPLTVCISCNEVIHTYEPMIRTSYGNYHGAPKTCVEGRPDGHDDDRGGY